MDPSRNPDGTFRSREEYERAMDELYNPQPVSRGIARASAASSMDLAGRRSHLASEDELRRIEEMQRPPQRSRSPPRSTGMMSATLARKRAIDAMIERARQAQLAFYAMLEQRYGAVRGDEHSYLVAMERYDYDMEKERKKREKVAAGTMVAFQSEAEMEAMIRGLDDEVRERLHKATMANQRASSHWHEYERKKTRKEEEELAEIERLRQEAERLRREYEARREHERRRREEEYNQFQERERQRRHHEQEQERRYQEQQRRQREEDWHQRQQQQQRQQRQQQPHGHARGARAASPPRRDEPESPKSALARRYPAPDTRQAAFAVLGLPASASKPEIKKAYRHGAMVLHPDKNPGNQDEATIRFQQLQQAYNLLNPQGGGRRRRHTRSHRHKSHKTHRRHHYHLGKTNRHRRRPHRK